MHVINKTDEQERRQEALPCTPMNLSKYVNINIFEVFVLTHDLTLLYIALQHVNMFT